MKRAAGVAIVALVALLSSHATAPALGAVDDRELRALRSGAQRERQQARAHRNQSLTEAAGVFRADAAALEAEYKERARSVDTEFQLDEVRMQAELDARIAALERELQKRLSAGLNDSRDDFGNQLKTLEQEARAHQDRLFDARRSGAQTIHAERLRSVDRKHALFGEMDRRALARAEELGLTQVPEPILAAPIGSELTRQEQQWNEREAAEVARLAERHRKLYTRFERGEAVRALERRNLDADFLIDWRERSELHALQAQQSFFDAYLLREGNHEALDQQAFLDRLADNAEQQRLIRIRYGQIRRENAIKRREERRALTGN